MCEIIQSLYPTVDRLVSNRKKVLNPLQELIFSKTNILTFHYHQHPLSLPGRLGFLQCCIMQIFFVNVKSVVDELDKDDAS